MTEKEEDYKNVKYLIEEFRKAEETEEYDDFLDIHRDYDELFLELVNFIEKYVLNKKEHDYNDS